MHQAERHGAILELLTGNGTLGVNEIALRFGVSRPTVRRDLELLEHQGLLARTHGGAVAHGALYELPLRYKRTRHSDEKVRIARAAAALILDGSTVGLTGGTTTTEIARALIERTGVTVVTTAINIASELAIRPNLRLVVTGGIVRSQSYELVGPLAEATLENLNLDLAFVGVDGISPGAGLTTYDHVEAHTNRVLLGRARRVVVVADSSKIGMVAFARIGGVDCIHELITDVGADKAAVEALEAVGVKVSTV